MDGHLLVPPWYRPLPASLHVIFLPSSDVKVISLRLQLVPRLGAGKGPTQGAIVSQRPKQNPS